MSKTIWQPASELPPLPNVPKRKRPSGAGNTEEPEKG